MQEETTEEKPLKAPVRWALLLAGTVFLALGLVGVFIPVLPTTPFLLLAAACYARSSKRFYNWLMSNKVFGKYISNYREGRGVPRNVKLLTLLFLWATILTSAFIFIEETWVKALLIIIALAVSAHILTLKTLK